MAYMNKEKKAKIVEAVKAVLPKGWKATFAVRHYSTIVMTVQSAPLDLAETFQLSDWEKENSHFSINPYRPINRVKDIALRDSIQKVVDALNTDNHDNSDVMTDYFDVGHYVDLQFGTHAKGFKDSRKILKPTKAQTIKLTKDLF